MTAQVALSPAAVKLQKTVQEMEALLWKVLADRAVKGTDPDARRVMAPRIRDELRQGKEPLPAPAVVWLIYVLENLPAAHIPHKHVGRPANTPQLLRNLKKLAQWWAVREKARPRETVVARIIEAASELSMSESTVSRLRKEKSTAAVMAVIG